jgi:acyl-CoA reductase-like NAD-dependent aldehyde dehydrogenase
MSVLDHGVAASAAIVEREMRSINPATGELIARYQEHDASCVDEVLNKSRAAYTTWRESSVDERAERLRCLASALRARSEQSAALITAEMGKPITQSTAEVEKSATVCEFYAENLADMLVPESVELPEASASVQFLPLGPVLAIMPWNYPFWQVLRAAAPILAAGNTLVIKHAENVSGCALLLQQIFEAAGFGDGVVQTLLLRGRLAGELIADDRIAAATLTGSERAGVAVGETAGRSLKKCVLELGGSDAFIVLEDANVAAAAARAVSARFQNVGQSCIAAKRFILVDAIADDFLHRFSAAVADLITGDPTLATTEVGPMARADLRDELADQVRRGLEHGDRIVTGGLPGSEPGAFYPPTVVAVADAQSPLMREETFGPVAAVIRVPDEESAIAVANSSPYGLSSALWTQDLDRARRIAARIESGGCFINGMTASHPRLPFGGVKHSGFGRELSKFGLREFVNVQTVSIAR